MGGGLKLAALLQRPQALDVFAVPMRRKALAVALGVLPGQLAGVALGPALDSRGGSADPGRSRPRSVRRQTEGEIHSWRDKVCPGAVHGQELAACILRQWFL